MKIVLFVSIFFIFLKSSASTAVNPKRLTSDAATTEQSATTEPIKFEDMTTEQKNVYIQTNYHANDYFYSTICNETMCALPYGTCASENICLCEKGYINKGYTTESEQKICSYEQKSKTFPFIMELVFPIGIGHFYVSRYKFGLLKLFTFILLSVILAYMAKSDYFYSARIQKNALLALVSVWFFSTSFLILTIWWFIDWYFYLARIYTDSNEVPLI